MPIDTVTHSHNPKVLTTEEYKRMFEELDELARRNCTKLTKFVRAAWSIIEPNRPYQHNWHIDAMSEHLEAVTRRQIRGLILNVPPRHMKSSLVSVFWPAWVWGPGKRPSENWLFGSYSPKLSTRDAVKCRRLIESEWYHRLWGNCFELTSDQNEKMRYENSRSGIRIATSVGGTGTGENADVVVADDPHKVKEVESDTQRQGVLDWWDNEMSTRGNDPETFCKVVIMQRLHHDDLSGHLIEQGGYEHLCLPFEYEIPTKHYDMGARRTSIGFQDPRTREGELLWQKRYSAEAVETLKRSLNAYQRSGQLQQRPTPKDGVVFKREYFARRWQTLPVRWDELLTTWDLSFGDEKESAYNVGYCVGRSGPDYYVLDEMRALMDLPEQCRSIEALKERHPASREILVEKAANGKAAVSVLKRRIPGLILVTPVGSKEDRADAVSFLFETGNVLFPADLPWADAAIEEFISFGPKARYKDRVDALVHALERMESRRAKRRATALPESLTKSSEWSLSA